MTENLYRVLTIIFVIISVIGLIRFVGGVTAVNAGIFICPLILAVITGLKASKESRNP